MNYFYAVLLVFLGAAPALYTWLKERRLRRLALAELELARAVTAMECHMLSGATSNGDVCHDVVFRAMVRLQNARSYSLPWNMLRSPSEKQLATRRQLEIELASETCPFRGDLAAFSRAHYDAFRHKHPFQQKMHFLYVMFLYVSARGVVYCLRKLIGLFVGWEKFMEFLRRQFFLQAGAYEVDNSGAQSSLSPLSLA
ncbi:MAG: hypothetical protein H7A55_04365 [Verrucomicrobiaceae bacterium]|nr:hypothetical protein [Verrucomicrobiaceae bacterium]